MAQRVANYFKALVTHNPVLFDRYTQGRRRLIGTADPLYDALDRFSQTRQGLVRFIVVGAGDGLIYDPLREFIVRDDWRGVMAEPEPGSFARLQRNYTSVRFPHLRLINAAVLAREDEAPCLYTLVPSALSALPVEARSALTRLATLNRARLVESLGAFGLDPAAIMALDPAVTTIERLARTYFDDGQFEFLMLDTSGHEAPLLTALDLDRIRPHAILFRADMEAPDKTRITARLVQRGYAVRAIGPFALALLV